MAILDYAIEQIRAGRPIFPGVPDEKIPAIKNPYAAMTTDERQILRWWKENPNYNICLPMGVEIRPGRFLGAIDFDVKDGRNGFDTEEKLAAIGLEFAPTLEQLTPNNGVHKIYYFDFAIGNGVNSLGPGIDHRGYHGFILCAGSWYHGKEYVYKNNLQIEAAQEWIAKRLQRRGNSGGDEGQTAPGDRQSGSNGERRLSIVHDIDQDAAKRRSIRYLEALPPASPGERNRRGFEAACQVKDFGLTRENTIECIAAHWKYESAFGDEPSNFGRAVEQFVNSAFKYGQNEPGISSPEHVFSDISKKPDEKKPKHPVDVMNETYALVIHNGVRIVRERPDKIDHLSVSDFHTVEANNNLTIGEKSVSVSKMWIKSPTRRQYESILFKPNYENKSVLNLWRGFSVSKPSGPVDPKGVRALDLFLEHIRENVCGGNEEHTKWVLGFFAHLIQKPEIKPEVALALRGKKGVGKNVITDCISRLLGTHYLLAANRRYLSGNFNSHFENKLIVVFDEAYWSGDKQAEGILKDLITGSMHQIERKGHEPYPVANLLRVVIFGNDEWVVPASSDERRFAVFEVGEKRRRDRKFFGEIKDGMKDNQGDQLLFQYLSDFDLSSVDVNEAPQTDALQTQKEHSLGPLESWWHSSLEAGYVIGSPYDEWVTEMPREALRLAFYESVKAHSSSRYLPNPTHFGRILKQIAPSSCSNVIKRDGEIRHRVQIIATLEVARQEWQKFLSGNK